MFNYGFIMSAINKSVKLIGGQAMLARLIGVKQSYIWNWVNRNQQAPAKYIRKISRATKGAVSIDELLKDHEISKTNYLAKGKIKHEDTNTI